MVKIQLSLLQLRDIFISESLDPHRSTIRPLSPSPLLLSIWNVYVACKMVSRLFLIFPRYILPKSRLTPSSRIESAVTRLPTSAFTISNPTYPLTVQIINNLTHSRAAVPLPHRVTMMTTPKATKTELKATPHRQPSMPTQRHHRQHATVAPSDLPTSH